VIRRHTIADADNRRLAEACGPLDEHLRRIESALGLSLQRRGALFRVQGPAVAVDRAVVLIDALYAGTDGRRAPVDAEELELLLAGEAPVAAAPRPQADATSPPSPPAEPVLHTRHAELRGRTPNQVRYLQQMLAHDITFGIGPAGTGKTWLAVAHAAQLFERKEVDRIILTRPAVEAGERLGFLPGDLKEKVDPYLRPIYDALYDLMDARVVERALQGNEIEIAPLAFMRGRTLTNAAIILDEAQNTTSMQMKMFLTRLGENSRMIVTGDPSQIDLPNGQTSGLAEAVKLLDGVEGIAQVHFKAEDVIRHELVARIVAAYEGLPQKPANARS